MTNPLELSDEDFLKMAPPSDAGNAGTTQETSQEETQVAAETPATEETVEADAATTSDSGTDGDPAEGVGAEEGEGSSDPSSEQKAEESQDNASPGSAPGDAAASPEDAQDKKIAPEGETKESTLDYKGFYEKIMTPFKANGKTVELKSPDEAIQLMQMGANYTRKLQELAPHRKVLLMLQNNGLLDEQKLSFLIDIEKKNPEAIKKLVKDSGIDPLEMDLSKEPEYRGGNHLVTDEAVAFSTVLEDVKSSQGGMETLQHINSQWDQASKEVLWTQPELMQVIHAQRENGIYAAIASEIDRRKTLGQVSPNTPFLTAYKTVGDEMAKAGAFAHLGQAQAPSQAATAVSQDARTIQAPAPVVKRAVQPKPVVTNGDKVTAASPTRAASQKVEKNFNPLALSDEDFLKQFANRL